MTREETKEAAEVMIAFANGKKIEKGDIHYGGVIWVKVTEPDWNWYANPHLYRIAPDQEEPKEKHYRPYTREEFIEEMRKHDGFIKKIENDKTYGSVIVVIGYFRIHLELYGGITYQKLLERFVWSDDGTPCGKEVTK